MGGGVFFEFEQQSRSSNGLYTGNGNVHGYYLAGYFSITIEHNRKHCVTEKVDNKSSMTMGIFLKSNAYLNTLSSTLHYQKLIFFQTN